MTLKSTFISHFGTEPMAYGRAFGRANLIGDHTDYNDGFVLPCLLNHHTDVALRLNDTGRITGHSDHFAPESSAIDSQSDGSWLDFVRGAIAMVAETGIETKGLDVCVRSNVPAGAGVSSSAALEIALIRGLLSVHEAAPMDAGIMARYAQRIEHEFVGTQCGIMDQMVSAAASPGQAMLLDCRSLDSALHALFDTADQLRDKRHDISLPLLAQLKIVDRFLSGQTIQIKQLHDCRGVLYLTAHHQPIQLGQLAHDHKHGAIKNSLRAPTIGNSGFRRCA